MKNIKTIWNKIWEWLQDRFYWVEKLWDLFRYDIPRFFHNLWYFKKALWQFGNWDFQYTLQFMLLTLKPLREGINNGYEVDESKNKKLIQMDRTIELLQNLTEDNFIEQAEKVHGELIIHPWIFKPVEDKPDYSELMDNDTPEEKEHNSKVFDLSHQLEEKQWIELWDIIKGNRPATYSKFMQVLSSEQTDTDTQENATQEANDYNESARSWWW